MSCCRADLPECCWFLRKGIVSGTLLYLIYFQPSYLFCRFFVSGTHEYHIFMKEEFSGFPYVFTTSTTKLWVYTGMIMSCLFSLSVYLSVPGQSMFLNDDLWCIDQLMPLWRSQENQAVLQWKNIEAFLFIYLMLASSHYLTLFTPHKHAFSCNFLLIYQV